LDSENLSDGSCWNADASVVDELHSKRDDMQEDIFDDEEDKTGMQDVSDNVRQTISDDEEDNSNAA
jgi:hypothetical protein